MKNLSKYITVGFFFSFIFIVPIVILITPDKKINEIENETTQDMAVLFKMFADATRLKILQSLINTELNVCEIAYLLNMTHSAISHQLATLKMANLVKARKSGKEVYYYLSDEHVEMIIKMGKEHVMEED